MCVSVCEGATDVSSGSPMKNEVTWLSLSLKVKKTHLHIHGRACVSVCVGVCVCLSVCIHARPRVSVCRDRWLLIVFS